MKKLPPLEKVYEAYSVLADERFDLAPDHLTVRSSDGTKEYTVTWDDAGHYRSNDRATYWQGYAGYPVIAALLLQGRLPLDEEVAAGFAGIPWKALNDACKRDYAAAASEAFRIAGFDMGQVLRAEEAADEVMAALGALDITVSRLATPVRTLP